MNILWRIIQHDWRILRRERVLPLFFVLSALLIGYGVFNGIAQARKHQQIAARLLPAQANQINEWKRQLREGVKASPDPANPYWISAQQLDLVLPSEPLALLAIGQSDLHAVNVKAYLWSSQGVMWAKSELQNPVNLQAGRFDLAFVVVWLFPLLVLMLSYNLLAAEREDGTLALLLSQPISLFQLVLGKTLARASVAIGGFLLLALVGVLSGLLAAGVNPLDLRVVFGLCSWMALVIGYGLFWLLLAVFVNMQHGSAAKNALTLAGAWLLLVLVIPSLLSSVAALLYPLPPRAELIIADREAEPNIARDGARALASFRQAHPDLQPTAPTIELSDSRRQVLAIFLENNRAFETVAQRYDDQLARQQRWLDRIGWLSPAVVVNEALQHLAGTGGARFQQFRAEVWQWVLAQRAFFVPRVMRGDRLTLQDYAALPHFTWQEVLGWQWLKPILLGLSEVLLLILLLIVGSWRELRVFLLTGSARTG